MKKTTVKDRVDVLVHQAGSLRAAAKAVKIPHVTLWRLQHGKRRATESALKKLGLVRIVNYYLKD